MSLVKEYRSDGTRHPPKPLVGFDGPDNVFEVETILDRRESKRGKRVKTAYLVKWLGYGPENNTWEPAENILDPDLIKDYEKTKKRTVLFLHDSRDCPETAVSLLQPTQEKIKLLK